MSLAVQEWHWWLQHTPKVCRHIHAPKIDFVINTDASKLRWGVTDRYFQMEEGGMRMSTAILTSQNKRMYMSWKSSRLI